MSTRPTRVLLAREEEIIKRFYVEKLRMAPVFCTTTVPVPMGSKDDKGPWGGNPDRMIPEGTTLRIVMASRFGDCGLTDKLDHSFGYEVRLDWEDAAMTDIRLTRAPTP